MLEFFLRPETVVFSAALCLTLLICIAEAALLAGVGAGLGSLGAADTGAGGDAADMDGADESGSIMGWLNVGRLPLGVYAALLSALFGVCGIALQQLVTQFAAAPLPVVAAIPAALVLALPLTREGSRLLAPLVPRTQTEALGRADLLGLAGEVTLGHATTGSPAQVRVRDGHGTLHYVMVEPAVTGTTLAQGSSVMLVAKAGPARFLAATPDEAVALEQHKPALPLESPASSVATASTTPVTTGPPA